MTSSRREFLALLPAIALAAPGVHNDTIDDAVEYQTIENFGASDGWRIERLPAWSVPARNKVADLLFSMDKGTGLSCWRFNVGAGLTTKIASRGAPPLIEQDRQIQETVPAWSLWENEVLGGETLDAVARHAKRFLTSINAEESHVLVFAHGDIIRIVATTWLGLPPLAGRIFGGLVFSGSDEGNFFALDATTGKPVWDFQTGGRIAANPISFAVDGKQYVAIASSRVLYVFGL